MNKLVILAKNSKTYFIHRLMEEADDGQVQLLNPWEIARIDSTSDPVLVRTTSIHGSDDDLNFIKNNSLNTIPSLHALKTLRTKPLQFDYFNNMSLPFVPWISLQNASEEVIHEFSKLHPGPLLIKPHRGQGGWGVRVFENADNLIEWMNSTTDHEYLLQPYLGDHKELRIFFMGSEYICLERIKKGVAANFKQEGEAKVVDAPLELKEIVEKMARDLDLVYSAADFLISKNGPYLLEMNLVPGIEQLEAVTGRNIAKNLIKIFTQP